MRKIKQLKGWIEDYEEVQTAVQELTLAYDFYKEEALSEKEMDEQYDRTLNLLENLEMKNMLRHEEDKLGAVLKINAGAGGTESQDWAEMLYRMYQRYCDKQGYKTNITNWLGKASSSS
jgi:peptide chain release factor 2